MNPPSYACNFTALRAIQSASPNHIGAAERQKETEWLSQERSATRARNAEKIGAEANSRTNRPARCADPMDRRAELLLTYQSIPEII
jgi:hypothetical protein